MIAVEMGFKMQEQLKAKGWRFCFAIIFSIITRTLWLVAGRQEFQLTFYWTRSQPASQQVSQPATKEYTLYKDWLGKYK